jgi:hypothetical protein
MLKKFKTLLFSVALCASAFGQSYTIPNTASSPTWTGHHTFTLSPTLPTPTNPTDGANKAYVDNHTTTGGVTSGEGTLTNPCFVLGNGTTDIKADCNLQDTGSALSSTEAINAPQMSGTYQVSGFPVNGGSWIGAWSATANYTACSAVLYNGLNYVATSNSYGTAPVIPGTNYLYWYPEPYTLTDGSFVPTQFDCAWAVANAAASANPTKSYLLQVSSGTYSKCGNGEFAHVGRGTVSLVGAGRNTTNINQTCYSVEHYTASVTSGSKTITTTSTFPFQYGDIVDNDTGFAGIPPHTYVTAIPTISGGVTTLTVNNTATATNTSAPLIWGAPAFRHLPDPSLSSGAYMRIEGLTISTNSYTLGGLELDGLQRSVRSYTYTRDSGYNPSGISSGVPPVGNYPSVLIGNFAFNGGYSFELTMAHNTVDNYPTVASGSPGNAALVAFVTSGSVSSVAVGREYTANVTSGSNTLTITSGQNIPSTYVGLTIVNGNGFAGIPTGATITAVSGGTTITFSGSAATVTGTNAPVDILTAPIAGATGNFAYNAATIWFLGTTTASSTITGSPYPCTTPPTGTANLVANGNGSYSLDPSNPVTITNNGGGTCQNDVHVQAAITIPQDDIETWSSMSDTTIDDEAITGGANVAGIHNVGHGGNHCVHCHVFNQGSEFVNYGLEDDNGGLVMSLYNSDSVGHVGVYLTNNNLNSDVFVGWSKYWNQGTIYPGSVDLMQTHNAPVEVFGSVCGDTQYWGGYHSVITDKGAVDPTQLVGIRMIGAESCDGTYSYSTQFIDPVYLNSSNPASASSPDHGSVALYLCGSHWVSASTAPEPNCTNMTFFVGNSPQEADIRVNGPSHLLDMGLTQWFFNLLTPLAADGTNNYPGPYIQMRGSYNSTSGAQQDQWVIKPVIGATGINPFSVLSFAHPNGTAGNVGLAFDTIIGNPDLGLTNPFAGYTQITAGQSYSSLTISRPANDSGAVLEVLGGGTGTALHLRSSSTGNTLDFAGSSNYFDNLGNPYFGVEHLSATQATGSCSGGGTYTYSQPERGSSLKLEVITLSACLGNPVVSFTVAFTATPSVFLPSGFNTIQSAINTTGCSTTASSYAVCNMSVTWPTAFPSTTYAASCTPVGPTDTGNSTSGRAVGNGITAQTTTGVTYQVATQGSNVITFTGMNCIASNAGVITFSPISTTSVQINTTQAVTATILLSGY